MITAIANNELEVFNLALFVVASQSKMPGQ